MRRELSRKKLCLELAELTLERGVQDRGTHLHLQAAEQGGLLVPGEADGLARAGGERSDQGRGLGFAQGLGAGHLGFDDAGALVHLVREGAADVRQQIQAARLGHHAEEVAEGLADLGGGEDGFEDFGLLRGQHQGRGHQAGEVGVGGHGGGHSVQLLLQLGHVALLVADLEKGLGVAPGGQAVAHWTPPVCWPICWMARSRALVASGPCILDSRRFAAPSTASSATRARSSSSAWRFWKPISAWAWARIWVASAFAASSTRCFSASASVSALARMPASSPSSPAIFASISFNWAAPSALSFSAWASMVASSSLRDLNMADRAPFRRKNRAAP